MARYGRKNTWLAHSFSLFSYCVWRSVRPSAFRTHLSLEARGKQEGKSGKWSLFGGSVLTLSMYAAGTNALCQSACWNALKKIISRALRRDCGGVAFSVVRPLSQRGKSRVSWRRITAAEEVHVMFLAPQLIPWFPLWCRVCPALGHGGRETLPRI